MLKVEKVEIDVTGYSVLISNTNFKYSLWVDVWGENEDNLECDWNQYIFLMNDENDILIKDFQENVDNFDEYSSLACETVVEYLNN